MKSFKEFLVENDETIAYHKTDERSAQQILKNGFKASKVGWYGSGLYAHLLDSKGKDGSGEVKVYFDFSDLKIHDDNDYPQEFTEQEWNKARKDTSYYRKLLLKYEYDGVIISDKRWIHIFPSSLKKLHPFMK